MEDALLVTEHAACVGFGHSRGSFSNLRGPLSLHPGLRMTPSVVPPGSCQNGVRARACRTPPPSRRSWTATSWWWPGRGRRASGNWPPTPGWHRSGAVAHRLWSRCGASFDDERVPARAACWVLRACRGEASGHQVGCFQKHSQLAAGGTAACLPIPTSVCVCVPALALILFPSALARARGLVACSGGACPQGPDGALQPASQRGVAPFTVLVEVLGFNWWVGVRGGGRAPKPRVAHPCTPQCAV